MIKVYLVFLKVEHQDRRVITICSSEEAAYDLGKSYVDRLCSSWFDTWVSKHNSEPAYKPRTYPDFEVVEVQLDQREIGLWLVET